MWKYVKCGKCEKWLMPDVMMSDFFNRIIAFAMILNHGDTETQGSTFFLLL